jgi:predicted HicB family RNase H-like nuclease
MVKTKRFGMRVSPAVHKEWQKVASQEGMSVSEWLRMLAEQRMTQVEAMRNASE